MNGFIILVLASQLLPKENGIVPPARLTWPEGKGVNEGCCRDSRSNEVVSVKIHLFKVLIGRVMVVLDTIQE